MQRKLLDSTGLAATANYPHHVQLFVEELAMQYYSAQVTPDKFKPYLVFNVGGRLPLRTSTLGTWARQSGMSARLSEMFSFHCDLNTDFVRIELWSSHLFKDELLATAEVRASELLTGHAFQQQQQQQPQLGGMQNQQQQGVFGPFVPQHLPTAPVDLPVRSIQLFPPQGSLPVQATAAGIVQPAAIGPMAHISVGARVIEAKTHQVLVNTHVLQLPALLPQHTPTFDADRFHPFVSVEVVNKPLTRVRTPAIRNWQQYGNRLPLDSHLLLYCSPQDTLRLELYDERTLRDNELAVAYLPLSSIMSGQQSGTSPAQTITFMATEAMRPYVAPVGAVQQPGVMQQPGMQQHPVAMGMQQQGGVMGGSYAPTAAGLPAAGYGAAGTAPVAQLAQLPFGAVEVSLQWQALPPVPEAHKAGLPVAQQQYVQQPLQQQQQYYAPAQPLQQQPMVTTMKTQQVSSTTQGFGTI